MQLFQQRCCLGNISLLPRPLLHACAKGTSLWQPYFLVHFWLRKPPTPSPVGSRRQVQRQIPLYLSLLPGQGAELLCSDATELLLGQLGVLLLKVFLALSQPQLKGANWSGKKNLSIWKSDPGLHADKIFYIFYLFLKRDVFFNKFFAPIPIVGNSVSKYIAIVELGPVCLETGWEGLPSIILKNCYKKSTHFHIHVSWTCVCYC